MTSFGKLFRSAREEKGWTVEFASFQSKIQVPIIEKLESDDYSGFSSPSYVKSFLRKYSELLELDLDLEINDLEVVGYDAVEVFAAREGVRESLETAQFSKKRQRFEKAQKNAGAPVFLVGSVVVLLSAIAAFYYLGSQANIPQAGAGELSREFDSQPTSFSREREASERLVSEKSQVSPLQATGNEPAPLASTKNQPMYTPQRQSAVLLDPDNDFAPLDKPDLRNMNVPVIDEKPLEQPASLLDPGAEFGTGTSVQ